MLAYVHCPFRSIWLILKVQLIQYRFVIISFLFIISLGNSQLVSTMSASIDVTLGVHEKFKNYKYNSAFREKSDADLLSYVLDSFLTIECLGNIWIV